jgi:hypothetical protein
MENARILGIDLQAGLSCYLPGKGGVIDTLNRRSVIAECYGEMDARPSRAAVGRVPANLDRRTTRVLRQMRGMAPDQPLRPIDVIDHFEKGVQPVFPPGRPILVATGQTRPIGGCHAFRRLLCPHRSSRHGVAQCRRHHDARYKHCQ